MHLALFPKPLEHVVGLDLVILEPDATVQHLADAFQPFAGCEGGLYKRKLRGAGECRACRDSCCTTSIIAPDPISFSATASLLGVSRADLLSERSDPAARAAGVVRYRSFPCTFLSEESICTIYAQRSLICRFFICSPYTADLQDLVHNILGAGLAGLAHQLRAEGLLTEQVAPWEAEQGQTEALNQYESEFHRLYSAWLSPGHGDPGTMPPAMAANPFLQATTYDQLPLWQFTTPDQWRRLTRGAIPFPENLADRL